MYDAFMDLPPRDTQSDFAAIAAELDADEYGNISEFISHHDEACSVFYEQVVAIMQGGGAASLAQALHELSDRGAFMVGKFRDIAQQSTNSMERLDRCSFIAQFIAAENAQRIKLFGSLAPEGEFLPVRLADLEEYLAEQSIEADSTEEFISTTTQIYLGLMNKDLSTLSEHFPQNMAERRALRREVIRGQLAAGAYDVMKVAAGAGLALFAANRLNRK